MDKIKTIWLIALLSATAVFGIIIALILAFLYSALPFLAFLLVISFFASTGYLAYKIIVEKELDKMSINKTKTNSFSSNTSDEDDEDD